VILTVAVSIVSYLCDVLATNLTSLSGSFISPAVMTFCFVSVTGAVPEHFTDVRASMKNITSESITIPITSSLQLITLIPSVLVFLSMFRGRMFHLEMKTELLVVLNIATSLMFFAMIDKKTNYVKGHVMICSYVVMTVLFTSTYVF
jgi:calcium/proton exchanger cax